MKLSGLVSLVLVGGLAVAQDWTSRSAAVGPGLRMDHAMCFDPIRNYVLLAGGTTGPGFPSETWSWDGTAWTLRGTGPSSISAMAFHAASGKLLGFSFAPGSSQVSAYEWDGSNWLGPQLVTIPGLVFSNDILLLCAGYDAARGEVLVQVSNKAGQWQAHFGMAAFDGNTWRSFSPLSGGYPVHSMAWDPQTSKLIAAYNYVDFIWVNGAWLYREVSRYVQWNGLGWTSLLTQDAPSRSGAMSTDSIRGSVLIFDEVQPGGQIPGVDSSLHTWTIEPSTCRQVVTRTLPPARRRHAMAYDPVRNVTVLFGGQNQFNSPMGDTWELTLGTPASFTGYGTGCPGSRGVPQLFAINNDIPRTGSLFETQVNNLPWNAPTFLLFGLSNTNSAGLPLPFDLSVAGAPGCTLLTSIDNIIPLTNVLGSAVWSLQMPHLPGASFYLQAVPFEASANALGVALSNGGHGLLGL